MRLHPLLLNRLLVLILLSLGLVGYFLAEDSLVLRVVALLLSLVGAFFLLVRRRISFPVLLALYLGVVSLTDWYFVSQTPLLGLIASVIGLELLLGYGLMVNEGLRPRHPAALYLLVMLLMLEVLLIYSFYLVSPTAIGLLVLVYFYAIWGVLLLAEQKALTLKASGLYVGLALLLTLVTLFVSGGVS